MNIINNFNLDKSSRKYICPSCGMKTFVRFVNSSLEFYSDDSYGRCDREIKCGYFKSLRRLKKYCYLEFITIKSVSDKSYRIVDLQGVVEYFPKSQVLGIEQNRCLVAEWILLKRKMQYLPESKYLDEKEGFEIAFLPHIEKDYDFHEISDVIDEKKKCLKHNLSIFLYSIFDTKLVDDVLEKYMVSGTNYFWNNSTIFWQIDSDKKVHAGKVMLYDPVTGRRKKKPHNFINWYHKLKASEFKLDQCLFGLHLVKEKNKVVCIVESEKTALVASILMPNYYWLATGAKHNLKESFLNPLKKQKIILFPDKGCFIDWDKKAKIFEGKGFEITASNLVENSIVNEGEDLADLYLK